MRTGDTSAKERAGMVRVPSAFETLVTESDEHVTVPFAAMAETCWLAPQVFAVMRVKSVPFVAAEMAVPFPFRRPVTEVEMVRTGLVALVKLPANPFAEATEKVEVAKVVSAPVPPVEPMSP